MKKEIQEKQLLFLIGMFVMPIITFIGLVMLLKDVIKISDVISVSSGNIITLITGELILFILCWVALFISFFLHKYDVKIAQIVVVIFAFGYLILNSYVAMKSYASIADILNPIIVLSVSLYAIVKSDKVVKKTPKKKNTNKKN